MNKLVYLALMIGIICSAVGLSATSNVAINTDSTQALGVHFGIVSGYGLGYRYFFKEGSMRNVGIQGVIGGFSSGNNDYSFNDQINAPLDSDDTIIKTDKGRKYYLNIGLNGIYHLKKTTLFTFYLTGGLNWVYQNQKMFQQKYTEIPGDTTHFEISGNVNSSTDITSLLSMGVGPGVEVKLGKFFKLSLELPITYTGKHELIMYVPAVGLYYYFK